MSERSAYPHPSDFKVMRPEYTELEDGNFQALIPLSPFKVTGESCTKAGARRSALYKAAITYKSYHPSYRVESPYPEKFTDEQGVDWFALPVSKRAKFGDYAFLDEDGDEDYAAIESMLLWDVRIKAEDEE